MKMIDNSPEALAEVFVNDNFPLEQYERLQMRRRERVEFWKDKDQPAILKENEELAAHGEEVLKLMRKAYESKKNILH